MKNLFSIVLTTIIFFLALCAKGGTNTTKVSNQHLSFPMGGADMVTNACVAMVSATQTILEQVVSSSQVIQLGRILTNRTFASKAELDEAIQSNAQTLINTLAMNTNASSNQLYRVSANAYHVFPRGNVQAVFTSLWQFKLMHLEVTNLVGQLPDYIPYDAPNATVATLTSRLRGTSVAPIITDSRTNTLMFALGSGTLQLPASVLISPQWSNSLVIVYSDGTNKSSVTYDSSGKQLE